LFISAAQTLVTAAPADVMAEMAEQSPKFSYMAVVGYTVTLAALSH
jgi:hypothetical protein